MGKNLNLEVYSMCKLQRETLATLARKERVPPLKWEHLENKLKWEKILRLLLVISVYLPEMKLWEFLATGLTNAEYL